MCEDVPAYHHIPFQNIPEGTSSTGYVGELVIFLEKYLPTFPKDRKVVGTMNENDLTEQLFLHLRRKANFNPENFPYPFEFQPEKPQKKKEKKGHSKRIDIASRLNTIDIDMEVIYCIEAKKLPTPGKEREKEYVSGEGGAIERFKNEVHGLDDVGSLLENNGIIAYVTEGSFEHWHTQINIWMNEALYDSSEALQNEYFHVIGKLTSKHTRISGSALSLTHFWVSV